MAMVVGDRNANEWFFEFRKTGKVVFVIENGKRVGGVVTRLIF